MTTEPPPEFTVVEPPPDFPALAKRLDDALALVECALIAASITDIPAQKEAVNAVRETLRRGADEVFAIAEEIRRLLTDPHGPA